MVEKRSLRTIVTTMRRLLFARPLVTLAVAAGLVVVAVTAAVVVAQIAQASAVPSSQQALAVRLVRPRRSFMAGTVESAHHAAGSFTVKTLRGATVALTVNGKTHYRKLGSGASNFAALAVGSHVIVVATKTTSGSLMAKRVLIVPQRLAGMRLLRGLLSPQLRLLRPLRACGLATAAQI